MKNTLKPVLVIIAMILGFVIYKHFNFSNVTFKDPWLDTVYIITFVTILFLLIKDRRQSSKQIEK